MEIKELEDRVWQDIARARASFAIIDSFLIELTKSEAHIKNKYTVMTVAIWWAAMDSLMSALGRLLRAGDGEECTLAKFRNAILKELASNGPKLNISDHSKESLAKLKDRQYLSIIKSKQEEYKAQVMPWRNKIVAHTIPDNGIALPKNLADIVSFVEDTHRICLSAWQDTGNPNQYIAPRFKVIAQEWVEKLRYESELSISGE